MTRLTLQAANEFERATRIELRKRIEEPSASTSRSAEIETSVNEPETAIL